MPLYQQEMEHPPTGPDVYSVPVREEREPHPSGPLPVVGPPQEPWAAEEPPSDVYQRVPRAELHHQMSRGVGAPQAPPQVFDVPDAEPGPWNDLVSPELLQPVESPGSLALGTVTGGLELHEAGDGLEVAFEDPDAEAYQPADVPKMPHLAGLDGLRGLALLAVLTFSGGVAQIHGGFLGISTAFTLSGFLITTMMLSEWAQRSQIKLGDLWERRSARIIPIAYAVVALVVALQATLRVGSVPTFRTDVWTGLGFVTNWQRMFPAEGFASSFNELSALQHLWPVAIVVQLTVLLPLIFVGLMAVTSRNWRTAGLVFSALTVASYATAWIQSGNPQARDIVYYGTHTRAGEVLLGVVLAYLILTPSFRSAFDRPKVLALIRRGGLLALAGLVALWVFTPVDSPMVFQGGTVLNGLLTAWVVFAVTMPGPTSQVLSLLPLRKLGEISLSAYLLHWPVFLLLDGRRTGLDDLPLLGVRLGATLVVAIAAVAIVESSFRWRLALPRAQLATGLLATAAILAVLVAILPVNPPLNINLTVNDGTGPGVLDVVTPAGDEGEAARVLVVGDETAASTVPGFAQWNEENPSAQLRVDTHVAADCPLGGPGQLQRFGQTDEPTLDCEAWRFRLPNMLKAAEYDVIVVLMGSADLGERQISRSWRHLGDPAYDRWMAEQIAGLGDVVSGSETPVVWLTSPHFRLVPDSSGGTKPEWSDFDDNDPHRVDRLNALIHAGVERRRGMEVVDLDWWLQNQPGGQFNPEIRVSSELTEAGANAAASWLAPQLLAAAGIEPEAEPDS